MRTWFADTLARDLGCIRVSLLPNNVQDLEKRTDEGVCKMDLLRSLHPVEFDNFIERVDRDRDMFTIRQEIEDRVTDSPERRNLALQDIRAQMQQCGLLHR